MINKRVAIIGCGNIGISLLQGLLKQQNIPACDITATRRNIEELAYLKGLGVNMLSDNIAAVNNSDLIIIAVPVDVALKVLPEVLDLIDNQV